MVGEASQQSSDVK
ncbi:hypothetical protein RDI58_001257 [Solanum bulbocastanum]|uniref:Uncharacterized protein n=1 Tax=Solanum bulbocastanum TaxID=147425 RepID=A0AAN8YN15_SOLBU